VIRLADPDRAFAIGHVPSTQRDGVAALWALDEQLGQIVATTTLPMVGMMRLMWWREAITSNVVGHPVLAALSSAFTNERDAREIAAIVDGWEELLEPLPLSRAQLIAYASGRGTQLFELTAHLSDETCSPDAGAGWALVDFGLRCSDPMTSTHALEHASELFSGVDVAGLPRALRILVRLAQQDAAAGKRIERTRWKLLRSVA